MNQTVFIVAAAIIVSICTGAALYHWFTKLRLKVKLTRRIHRAIEGEQNARDFLLKNGFHITGEQVTINPVMSVDGVKEQFTVRADFLVRKQGRTAVVDAKSASKAANPSNPDTRRRMFEYFHCYNTDDVYIYDDVNKMLRRIEFTGRDNTKRSFPPFAAGFLSALLISLIVFLIVKMV